MDYPIQSVAQLSSQLQALRKARGLSQARLGTMLGVGQARVARIEQAPEAVSVEQFLRVLGVLGVQVVLRPMAAAPAPTSARKPGPAKGRPDDEPW